MPTIKKGGCYTSIVFADDSYVEKLMARNIVLDENGNLPPDLLVDFSHYSKRKRKDLSDSDFEALQREKNSIRRLTIRDSTVAKKVQEFDEVGQVQINVDDGPLVTCGVQSQKVDHQTLTFEFQ